MKCHKERSPASRALVGQKGPGPLRTTDSRIPIRLRTLRKIVEDTKNHDLERDLYIEERKAERGVYLHQRFNALKEALKKAQINEALRSSLVLLGDYWGYRCRPH